MQWQNFWALHRAAYLIVMWIVSIEFATLGIFILFVGFQRPLLFVFVPLCFSCCAVANPWAVRRYQRWRKR